MDLSRQRMWARHDGKQVAVGPSHYTFGVGVIMDNPTTPGRHSVVTSEGIEQTRPQIGLIIERDGTFWEGLRACVRRSKIEDITKHLFEVTRTGTAPKHSFCFRIVGDAAVSIPPEAAIDLDRLLDSLVSEERLEACISGRDERHCLWS